jgi:hypothetical protein
VKYGFYGQDWSKVLQLLLLLVYGEK